MWPLLKIKRQKPPTGDGEACGSNHHPKPTLPDRSALLHSRPVLIAAMWNSVCFAVILIFNVFYYLFSSRLRWLFQFKFLWVVLHIFPWPLDIFHQSQGKVDLEGHRMFLKWMNNRSHGRRYLDSNPPCWWPEATDLLFYCPSLFRRMKET